MNFPEALEWLYATQWHGFKLGLESTQRLAGALALDLTGQSGPQFLHVAGTNGKGSTCAMLDAILRASGRRTGLYTSPHLVDFRERIAVKGEQISEAAVAEGLSLIREIVAGWEPHPTFFEITTVLALWHFQRAAVELAVLETGLGGRLDATNIVTPRLSIIAPIDMDHQQWLGHSLAEIALEKAGIIKTGVPCVSAPQPEAALKVLTHIAVEREAEFHLVMSPLASVPLALAGSHQRWNAALAVHALDVAGLPVPNEALIRGLATVRWPGRFQRLEGDRIVLDGAHNLAAARQLQLTWREHYPTERATLILGMMRDKDLAGICRWLAPIARRVIAVPVPSPRSATPEEVRAAFFQADNFERSAIAADLDEAIDLASEHEERILVTGSAFWVCL